jgi:hypothetical protein
MLTIDHAARSAAALPTIVRIGLVGLVLAGLADVVAHFGAPAVAIAGDGHEHTPAEHAAHLAGFVSMVLIQLGVVVDGVRRSRARPVSAGSQ